MSLPGSPNRAIDEALEGLMKQIRKKDSDGVPIDMAVKVINAAIAWEKVKHNINDSSSEFDPDVI